MNFTENVVYPEEIVYFIESIKPFEIVDVGSPKWFEVHEMIIKLSQQAALEAAGHREEQVKELLVFHDKLKVLIHEAYCVSLWKTRVLPHLLDIDPNPQATFAIYTVLYHEGAVISLLEATLYYETACETLQDNAIDLIDYCALGVSQVIGLASIGHHTNQTNLDIGESSLSELERQKRDLIYKIGLRCISILSYLADKAKLLNLNASRRMVVSHDMPWLMIDLLHFRPWQRTTNKGLEKYINEKWSIVKAEDTLKVTQHEAQAWFCLRQLVLNNELMQNYEFTDERRKRFNSLHGLMHECILDQLPPLIDLKNYLCRLLMTDNRTNFGEKSKSNLLLEELPIISEHLIGETEKSGGFIGIAQLQESIFLSTDKEHIINMAKRLNEAYNTDLLAKWEEKTTEGNNDKQYSDAKESTDKGNNAMQNSTCNNCFVKAAKKCSQCKKVYYCSRKCQLEDWSKHKHVCLKI